MLVFVGIKMLVTYFDLHVPIGLSLGVIGGVLLVSVWASLLFPEAAEAHDPVVHDSLERRPRGTVFAPIDPDDDNDTPAT